MTTIQEKISKSFEKNATRIAVEDEKGTLTYTELRNDIYKISTFIESNDYPENSQIGIYLKNSVDIIKAITGVLYARCVFVPLDVNFPEERIKSICKELNLEAIITSETQQLPKIFLDTQICELENILSANKVPQIVQKATLYNPEDNIYIYFTSGSTGVPKGIIGSNKGLLEFIEWETEAFNLQKKRFSQFISPYFDAYLRDVFVPLCSGGTICIPPKEEDFLSSEKLISWIDRSKVNVIHCVPSLFREFNSYSLNQECFQSLQFVFLSGERINPVELEHWYEVFKERIKLVNFYGTSEATMISSYYIIGPSDLDMERIPIGIPRRKTKLLVMSEKMFPCKTLETGNLYIVSDYLSKGYLNRRDQNKEKFVVIDGEKAFKTGDRARFLASGMLELLGRTDRLVKLSGIRIDLDDIENNLLRTQLFKQVTVVKKTLENGRESLIAFVIEDININKKSKTSLKGLLRSVLPEYMIPSHIIYVDEFPLLSNGKINYQLLEAQNQSKTHVVPSNKIESKILAIWKEILGEQPISCIDNFNSLGGNSLGIMRLIGRLYKEFNIRIKLNEIFENQTIQQQALLIGASSKTLKYDVAKSSKKALYNTSSAQGRMYYVQNLDKDSIAYNMPMAWEIKKNYDKERIENTIKKVIDRHESLRTKFLFENGKLFQSINDDINFKVEIINIEGEDFQSAMKKLIKPFDLSESPLMRCAILQSKGGKKILVVDIHHIICDGLSQVNLFSDFSNFYKGLELEPLLRQYKDYAEWEHRFKSTEEYIKLREFWLKSFEESPKKLQISFAKTSLKNEFLNGGEVSFSVNSKVFEELFRKLDQQNTTSFSIVLSIYYIFLFQISGQEDLTIGITSSGRMQLELEPIVGMFAKIMPIRYKVNPEKPFYAIVEELHSFFVQANSNQAYDLSNIISELNNKFDKPINDLFDVTFNYQTFDNLVKEDDEDIFSPFPFEVSSSKYLLTLFVNEGKDSFDFKLEYSSSHFSKVDMELFVSEFKNSIELIVSEPMEPIYKVLGTKKEMETIIEDNISFNF